MKGERHALVATWCSVPLLIGPAGAKASAQSAGKPASPSTATAIPGNRLPPRHGIRCRTLKGFITYAPRSGVVMLPSRGHEDMAAGMGLGSSGDVVGQHREGTRDNQIVPRSVQCPFDIAPGYGHEVCLSSEISGRVCAGVADLARARNGLGTGRHCTILPTALSRRVVLRCRIFSRKRRCHERSNLLYFRGCFSPFCDYRGALEERSGPYGGPILVGPQPPKDR